MSFKDDPATTEIHRFFNNPEKTTHHDEAEWLYAHGMLDDPDAPFKIETDQDWYQPGGESFILQFSVHQREVLSRFVMKACIVTPATATVSEWNHRRALLTEHGIKTPRLHAVDRATYIEEFIDHSLKDAFSAGDEDTREDLRTQFHTLHATSHALGFRPVSFHDVRSHGSDVVAIDFGSDLGGTFTQSGALSEARVKEIATKDFKRIVGKQ